MLWLPRLLVLFLAMGLCSACSKSTEDGATSPTAGGASAVEPAGIDAPAPPEAATGETESETVAENAGQPAQSAGGGSGLSGETPKVKQLSTGYDPETEENLPPKENVLGRWMFVLTQPQQGQDLHVFLVEVVKQDDGTTVGKLLASVPEAVPPNTKLVESDVTDKTVHFVFDLEGQQLDFQGALDGAIIRGNIMGTGVAPIPARMVPTEIADFSNYHSMQPTPGREEASAIRVAEDQVEATREFAENNPNSPMVPFVYAPLFATAAANDLDAKTVDALAAEMLEHSKKWGDRQVQFSQINVALNLAMSGYAADVSTRYLDQADKAVTAESLLPLKEYLDSGREQVELTQAREQLKSEDASVREAAFNKLQEVHAKQPFNPEVTVALANYAADNNLTDQAIDWFAELAALPNMEQMAQAVQSGTGDAASPLASERLATLWKEKHGSTEGLDDYLQKTYAEGITAFARAPVTEPRGEDARTSLVELFTGATCPPCVAADVATGGLEATYPSSSVIVLRYHMHIPGPDPLSNPHAEARFHGYGLQGTPAILLNGTSAPPAGGGITSAIAPYEALCEIIDGLHDQTTKLRLPISAKAEGSEVRMDVRAEGLDELPDSLRLRVALAEKEIWFPASNGIRRHDMVVRWLVGGPEGMRPEEGKLEFVGSHDIAKLKEELSAYLHDFEQSRGRLPAKPLDLQHLEVVAWVQDDTTGEILHAAAVPVEGTLDLGSADAEQPAPAEQEAEPAKPQEEAPKVLELKPQESAEQP